MRGAVSLAVALAIPLETDAGAAFPQRDLIIFLTFAVIFFTLVVQGLSLPALIHRLGVTDDGADADEELRARLVATKAAIDQIDLLGAEEWTRDETIERMRAMYQYRKRRLAARAGQDRGRRLRGPLTRLPADGPDRALSPTRRPAPAPSATATSRTRR